MRNKEANLKPDERAVLKLRGIYEQYGYKKYKMGRFEEYSLYANNKDFLAGDKVMTFTDLDGRLMALKPDVTLSIIKNTKATNESSEKLYYIENVYRESKESHTYKEINQLGLEFLGGVDLYGVAEVVSLAAQTLETISEDYILELSHMNFALELLNVLAVDENTKQKLIKHIRNKNSDGIKKTCERAGVSERLTRPICEIPFLYGEVTETLERASCIAINEEMKKAIDEMGAVYRILNACGHAQNVQVDFSIVNDIDYYNGIIFRGYIKRLARGVLSGGQYGNAMRKFGKDIGAIGFALYLNELSALSTESAKPDVDALVLYDAGEDPAGLIRAVSLLLDTGISVRTEKTVPKGLRFSKKYRFAGGKLIEEAERC